MKHSERPELPLDEWLHPDNWPWSLVSDLAGVYGAMRSTLQAYMGISGFTEKPFNGGLLCNRKTFLIRQAISEQTAVFFRCQDIVGECRYRQYKVGKTLPEGEYCGIQRDDDLLAQLEDELVIVTEFADSYISKKQARAKAKKSDIDSPDVTRSNLQQWYQDVESLLLHMRHLCMLASERMVNTFCVAEQDDHSSDEAVYNEQVKRELSRRSAILSAVVASRIEIKDELSKLRGEFGNLRLLERLKLAYVVLGDFEISGLASGRWLWPTFEDFCYKVRQWLTEIAPCWERETIGLDVEFNQAFEEVKALCPFNEERLNRFRQRLLLEESQLLRDFDTQSIAPMYAPKRESGELPAASERPRKKSVPKRRGRTPERDDKADQKLVRDWKAASSKGNNRTAFCRERGIKVKELEAAQRSVNRKSDSA